MANKPGSEESWELETKEGALCGLAKTLPLPWCLLTVRVILVYIGQFMKTLLNIIQNHEFLLFIFLYFQFKPLFSFNFLSEVGWGLMMGDKSQSLVFGKAHYDPYHHLFIWMVKWQFPGRLGQAIYCMLGESGWRLRRGRGRGWRITNLRGRQHLSLVWIKESSTDFHCLVRERKGRVS